MDGGSRIEQGQGWVEGRDKVDGDEGVTSCISSASRAVTHYPALGDRWMMGGLCKSLGSLSYNLRV